ncbi:MAG: Clp1/GlmU family protein [Acidobacteriota bacterium]
MEPVPEPGWEALVGELISIPGTVIVIGGVDSGKSTLVKYLVRRLVYEKGKVSLVDSDIGQSSLGLPGTISMKVFRGPKGLGRFSFQKMFFVGVTNPARRIASVATGTKRMVELCRKASATVLVDTTGLVTGGVGRVLKIRKIQAVAPEHVIALQRNDELEHILGVLSGITIHRLEVSEKARTRSRAERVRYRQAKFDAYFRQRLSPFLLRSDKVIFLRGDRPFSPEEEIVPEGSLVGLNHGGNTLAVGAVTRAYPRAVALLAPVRSLQKVDRILFGEIVYDLKNSFRCPYKRQ